MAQEQQPVHASARLLTMVLLLATLTAACSPLAATREEAAPGAPTSAPATPAVLTATAAPPTPTAQIFHPEGARQAVAGVSVSVVEVVREQDHLLVRFTVNAGPYYDARAGDFLAPHIGLDQANLYDQAGNLLAAVEREARYQPVSEAGTASYTLRAPLPPAGTEALTLTLGSVMLGTVPAKTTVRFDLEGRSEGDEWALELHVPFGPADLVLEHARLLEAEEPAYSYRLEFAYRVEGQGRVGLFCPRVYRVLRDSLDASKAWCDEETSLTYTEFGPASSLDLPLTTRPFDHLAVADLLVRGPWVLTIPLAEGK